MESQSYPGASEDFKLQLPDSLQLFEEEICLFLKGGHYDIIYRQDFFPEEMEELFEPEDDIAEEEVAEEQELKLRVRITQTMESPKMIQYSNKENVLEFKDTHQYPSIANLTERKAKTIKNKFKECYPNESHHEILIQKEEEHTQCTWFCGFT